MADAVRKTGFAFIRSGGDRASIVVGVVCAFFGAGMGTAGDVIGTDSKDGGAAATCRLVFRHADGKLSGTCSATLIGAGSVRTAAHCVAKQATEPTLSTAVECGYTGYENGPQAKMETTDKGSKTRTTGVNFRERRVGGAIRIQSHYDDAVGVMKNDRAEIDFAPPIITIPPVVEAARSEFFAPGEDDPSTFYPKRGVICRVEGFGIGPDGIAGTLRGASISDIFFDVASGMYGRSTAVADPETGEAEVEFRRCLETYGKTGRSGDFGPVAVIADRLVEALVTPGDSGGPLYCRTSWDKPWKLAGIASGGGIGPMDGEVRTGIQWSEASRAGLVSFEAWAKKQPPKVGF